MHTHDEAPLNERQSLDLIQTMIHAAREDYRQDAFYYLIWGWLVLVAALTSYALFRTGHDNGWLPWAILMPAGGLVSMIYGWRQAKHEKVRTPINTALNYLWGGFGVMLTLLLLYSGRIGWANSYPLIVGLYGLGTFASGGALRFRPLIWGGVACWALALYAFFAHLSGLDVLLLLAAAIVISYIVPGHLLKASAPSPRARTIAAV